MNIQPGDSTGLNGVFAEGEKKTTPSSDALNRLTYYSALLAMSNKSVAFGDSTHLQKENKILLAPLI